MYPCKFDIYGRYPYQPTFNAIPSLSSFRSRAHYLTRQAMTPRHLLFLVGLLPYLAYSQLTALDANTLRLDLAEQINSLRISKGLEPFIFNDTLKKAAKIHSDYMGAHDILTHTEDQLQHATPKDRVIAANGTDFQTVGENVLYSTPQDFPLHGSKLHTLATEMFNSWLHSPGHYANMTEPEYVYADLAFSTNLKNRIVYATHVFGTKGHKVAGQLSNNSFGLSEASHCGEDFDAYSNIILNLGNDLRIEGDQVTLYFHDIAYLQQILSEPNDGIAVDLVSRDQLRCGQPNQLDASSLHDGILLKPHFGPTILANNRAKSEYRVIAKIGDIPAELQGRSYSPSLILIKNGKACKYVYPAQIPRKRYALRPIEPLLQDEPAVHLVKQGVVTTQIVHYDFHVNSTSAVKLPKIQDHPNEIRSILIRCYSSVEGDPARNALLHDSRAAFIQDHLTQALGASPDVFRIHAGENWDQMDFQLNYFRRGDLAGIPHEELKAILAHRDRSLPWDSLLQAQRRATVAIDYSGEFKEDGTDGSLGAFNLRTAMASGNSLLANKALFEIYHSSHFDPSILFEPQLLEFVKAQPTLIANYAAVLALHYSEDPYQVTNFIHSCLYQADKLDDRARFNLNHLYTLIGTALLDNWDVSAQRLSNVIHPKKMALLSPRIGTPELTLNLKLTFIQYFGQVNDAANISTVFDYITDHFKKNRLQPKDDVDLALFFNNWSMYQLTLDHLLPQYKSGSLTDDGLFVLAQTMNYAGYAADTDTYVAILEKAFERNPTRWCNWVSSDFQIKRNHMIKRLYCERCP